MAARNLAPVRALNRELVPIVGSFAPNGSSAVAATSNKGKGWSVAWTSTGLFTITFTDKWADLVSVTATLQLATAAARSVQIGTWTPASKTLQIRVVDGSGVVQDVSANANNRINFVAMFTNSALPNRGS